MVLSLGQGSCCLQCTREPRGMLSGRNCGWAVVELENVTQEGVWRGRGVCCGWDIKAGLV